MLTLDAGIGLAALCGASLLALVALYTDWRWREIPHWLVAGLVLLWALTAWLATEALSAPLWAAVACGAGGLAAGLGFHALGWLGGGDGKLLAVVALWLGPRDLGLCLLATAALGLLLILAALAGRASDLRARGIPFACAIVPPAVALLLARAVALSNG